VPAFISARTCSIFAHFLAFCCACGFGTTSGLSAYSRMCRRTSRSKNAIASSVNIAPNGLIEQLLAGQLDRHPQ
jgi:hypothetical protein